MKRQLKPKPLYGIDRVVHLPNTYNVKKMTPELDVLESYSVYVPNTEIEAGQICDCYAGLMHKHCRHKQLVKIFLKEGAVDTPRLYEFDRQRWAD